MVGENVAESWFVNLWKSSRKSMSWEAEKPVLGIMAFEVSKLMSKVVILWHCLADRQIVRLREEIGNSIGIRKLVSENEDYLIDLAFAEIIENFKSVANSLIILGKKCTDPTYHNLERVFNEVGEVDPKWHGWQYTLKKMENKVKKMEKFVASTEQLYQELDVLAELEQSLRRMRASADLGRVKLLEFQQKVVWQRQEVKNLRETSPWVRTYDYIFRLLLKSIFTIFERIKYVYGTKLCGNESYEKINNDCLIRSNSLRPTLVHPSETNPFRLAVPIGRSFSSLGFGGHKTNKSKNSKSHSRSQSSLFCEKSHPVKAGIFAPSGFTGCMTGKSESPVVERYMQPSCASSFISNNASRKDTTKVKDILDGTESPTTVSVFNPKRRLLEAPPFTLGYAALAFRYANIIILIEKLASSPNLISIDARDDLYDMLPASIKIHLRAKLKTFSRNLGLSVYDATFAAEWSLAVTRILDWLSPLAHNMVRWQSERNFERQRLSLGSSVRLVQTLYFANKVETEAAIVELLMGLNYLSRFGREVNRNTFRESSCSQAYEGYVFPKDNMYYQMIDHA